MAMNSTTTTSFEGVMLAERPSMMMSAIIENPNENTPPQKRVPIESKNGVYSDTTY